MDGLSLSALHVTQLGRIVASGHGLVVGVKGGPQLVGDSCDGRVFNAFMVQQWAWYGQAKLSMHGTGLSLSAVACHRTWQDRC